MFSKLFKLKGNHPTQLRQLHYIQERTPIAEQYISKIKIVYTGSLSSPDFKGAFFNHGHFQKITRIFSLCPFSLHNWRNFFNRDFLVTNAWIKYYGFHSCRFLPDLEKIHEPRTRCTPFWSSQIFLKWKAGQVKGKGGCCAK